MPNYLRWLTVVAALALAAAFSWFAYQKFAGPMTWRVAVSHHRADDALILERLGEWLKQRGRRTRLEVVMLPSEEEAVKALREQRVDLAAVRGDTPVPGSVASLLSIYRELIVFVVPEVAKIENWQGLSGKTVALLGHTQPDDRLIQKVLGARQVTGVKFVAASREEIEGLVKSRRVQAIAQVAPLNIAQQTDIKAGRSVRRIRGAASMLEIADAEAISASDNRYESFDVSPGILRDVPMLPEEETTTLSVLRHIVADGRVQGLTVQRMLIDMMDAKRGTAPDHPMVRQIGSPGVDKDAAMKVHPAALSYFNGEEMRLIDTMIEWVYILPMLIGGLGAGAAWLHRFLWPAEARRAQDAIVELMIMRREAAMATDLASLENLEERRMKAQEEIDHQLAGGVLKDKLITALLVAADATDRKIDQRREWLTARRVAGRLPHGLL